MEEYKYKDITTGEEKTISKEDYFQRFLTEENAYGYTCLGKLEYENMRPVNEGVFGPEDFLWFWKDKDNDIYYYVIGANPMIGDAVSFKSSNKYPDINVKQFLTMIVSTDVDHGITGTKSHLVEKVVERKPKIRLEGQEWIEVNLDYYNCTIDLRDV